MKIDSLAELETAFVRWRKTKRHVREQVPDRLCARARRAARVHGLTAVVRATKLERSRLVGKSKSTGEKAPVEAVPSFSRLELSAPSATSTPIAELETAKGIKLRIFTQTPETLSLLSSLCGIGGTP